MEASGNRYFACRTGIYCILAVVAEEGTEMKWELLRYLCHPLYWVIIGGGMAVRFVMAWLDRLHRPEIFWALSIDFWNKIGSVTEGFLIVLVLIHLFSVDKESGTKSVINSTAHGRKRLLRERLIAGMLAAVAGTSILTFGNLSIIAVCRRGMPFPEGWIAKFMLYSAVAFVGSVGFFLLCACVCDMTQNQPVAMCVCGLPFAISYFINADMVHPIEPLWLLRYGFFTELIRGRTIKALPYFWIGWYSILLFGALALAIKKRKERKEL